MPVNRFFILDSLDSGKIIDIRGNEYHHLIHVMRKKKGDTIELINGQNQLAIATVQEIKRQSVIAHIEESKTFPSPSFRFKLALASLPSSRLYYVIEKGTELGVTEFLLFSSSLVYKKNFNQKSQERLQGIMISALKQSGRLDLPKLSIKKDLYSITYDTAEGHIFFGDPQGTETFLSIKKSQPITFFIGPETGFSEKEKEYLKTIGAKGIKLGSHILRSDTAAICAVCQAYLSFIKDS